MARIICEKYRLLSVCIKLTKNENLPLLFKDGIFQ